MSLRRPLMILGGLFCAFLAFWAYQTSGKTRMALREMRLIEMEIAKEQERIEILRAEWAILNRSERLRDLVNKYNARLGLVQISANNYGETTQVPYPLQNQSDELPYIDPSDIDAILQDLIDSGEIELQ